MFTIANILTGFNLLAGVSSIICAFSGRLELAVVLIFIGALLDFLDGFVARLLKQPSELGKQLDSLADVVTFGVAPGVIVFILFILSGALDLTLQYGGKIDDFWLEGTMGYSIQYWISSYLNDLVGNENPYYISHFKGWYLVLPFVALFIPFMSMFRLAKFNLDQRQTENFIGLPTPANAIFFASLALLIWDGFGTEDWRSTLSLTLIKDQVLMTFVVVFSVLLIAELPLFSLKFKSFGVKENTWRYVLILISVVLLVLLYVWAIPLIIIAYILLSIATTKWGKA